MSRPHPLTVMKEWEWSRTWDEQQEIVDQSRAGGGAWLPNVVETRQWGAVRWTSGRPAHASESGQAVPETFAVLRPGLDDPVLRERLPEVLRDPPPLFQVAGIGARRHQLLGAAPGAVVGAALLGVLIGVLGLGAVGVVVGVLLGLVLGAVGGAAVAQYLHDRDRSAVLKDGERVRVVTGRYAPTSWARLVEATTGLERASAGSDGPDDQAAEAVQTALWEAAGLLLSSSDHTGVEVLADGMERLAQAHRG
ncbi:hypothetical protein CLV30_107144 [Haloactinopolyspora alba]|uniref:Uncharacterized protein n=1 Tax=Haloactinopolyspora alba TaxID=648780 RepID=A0A2P8E2I4_9ACTN|nr:hypothetical protein [Haloactinopolyspora alba]PSL03663.1 hypothetical protein CLV30_107144 [Haloactinopolyspora alba]